MLSHIERELLRHYSERERIISGQRTSEHRRLLTLGYIREERVHPNTSDRRIVVTPAGYVALESFNELLMEHFTNAFDPEATQTLCVAFDRVCSTVAERDRSEFVKEL